MRVGRQVKEDVIGDFTLEASSNQAECLCGWAGGFTKREWAVESANGLGYMIACQLVARDETVFDVPPVLASRTRPPHTVQGAGVSGSISYRSIAAATTSAPKAP